MRKQQAMPCQKRSTTSRSMPRPSKQIRLTQQPTVRCPQRHRQHKETVTTQQNDQGSREGHELPVRMCIGCRSHRPQQQLIRCTLGVDGATVDRTAPGRGAWVCSIECFDTAVRRKAFSRAWRREVPSTTLDALRIPFESVITNMKELTAAGTKSGTPMPTKG